jgi:hypothetical protein
MLFLAVKSIDSCALAASDEVLARLKPKRTSFTTVGLKMCVSLSAMFRILKY